MTASRRHHFTAGAPAREHRGAAARGARSL